MPSGLRPGRLPVPTRMLHWGMDAIYLGLMGALPLYAIARWVKDHKTRARWGAFARDIPLRFSRRQPREHAGPCVWVHGVSVGEVKAAARLISEIERLVPDVEVVISVTTDTGNRVARKHYPDHRIEFYPPDLSWIVRDAIDAIRPDLVILVESEFWPNFLIQAHARDLPVALVNGRMSARSARRFRRLRFWAAPLMQSLRAVCVQLPAYAERFATLDIPADRIHVTGNMKFDNIPPQPNLERLAYFRELLGTALGPPVIVAGSTHPGEEQALARIRRAAREAGLACRFVVAPRHPGRADTVEAQMLKEGIELVRRSELDGTGGPPDPERVVLLDTVGELEHVYALADAVFVGGTLVPHGGQNVMEPASLGKPVVIGPHFQNFRGEVDMLARAGGISLCADEAEVQACLLDWIADLDKARDVGRAARQEILDSKGATDKTVEILAPLLERMGAPSAADRDR